MTEIEKVRTTTLWGNVEAIDLVEGDIIDVTAWVTEVAPEPQVVWIHSIDRIAPESAFDQPYVIINRDGRTEVRYYLHRKVPVLRSAIRG